MKVLPVNKFLCCTLILSAALAACNNKGPDASSSYQPVFSSDSVGKNTLVFGFPSFAYSESAEPLMKYLNGHLSGSKVKLKACTSFEQYLELLKQRKFDLSLVNGIQALEVAGSGYSIVGKITDDDQYTGVIFSRKNAGITKIADLKGKSVALVPYRIIPGTMMPLYYLYENGLNVNHDIHRVNVSSFESTILSTYMGKTDAGVCLKRNWNVYIREHPEILSKVDLKWETPPLIHNALIVNNTVDKAILSQLLSSIFSMQNTVAGKAALKRLDVGGFEKANKDTYKPMMDFKKKYDAVIL